jgi:hypothetical protein
VTVLSSRSSGLWAAVLPLLSGFATYALCAGIAAATGNGCEGVSQSGSRGAVGLAFLLLIVVPPIVVGYRAIVARKSWPLGIALVLGGAILNYAAVCFALLVWAGGHNCSLG